jgi:hypothetical protein
MGDGRTTHLGHTRPIDNVRDKSQFAPDLPNLRAAPPTKGATVHFAYVWPRCPLRPWANSTITPGHGLSSNVPRLLIRRFEKARTACRTTMHAGRVPPNKGRLAMKERGKQRGFFR